MASSCHVSYERARARPVMTEKKKKKRNTHYTGICRANESGGGRCRRTFSIPRCVLARRTPTATAVYNIHILIFRAYVLGTRVPHSWLLEGTTVSSAVERKHPAKAPCCIGDDDGCARRFIYYTLTRCLVRTDTCYARTHSTPFYLFRMTLFTQFYAHFFGFTTFNVEFESFSFLWCREITNTQSVYTFAWIDVGIR